MKFLLLLCIASSFLLIGCCASTAPSNPNSVSSAPVRPSFPDPVRLGELTLAERTSREIRMTITFEDASEKTMATSGQLTLSYYTQKARISNDYQVVMDKIYLGNQTVRLERSDFNTCQYILTGKESGQCAITTLPPLPSEWRSSSTEIFKVDAIFDTDNGNTLTGQSSLILSD